MSIIEVTNAEIAESARAILERNTFQYGYDIDPLSKRLAVGDFSAAERVGSALHEDPSKLCIFEAPSLEKTREEFEKRRIRYDRFPVNVKLEDSESVSVACDGTSENFVIQRKGDVYYTYGHALPVIQEALFEFASLPDSREGATPHPLLSGSVTGGLEGVAASADSSTANLARDILAVSQTLLNNPSYVQKLVEGQPAAVASLCRLLQLDETPAGSSYRITFASAILHLVGRRLMAGEQEVLSHPLLSDDVLSPLNLVHLALGEQREKFKKDFLTSGYQAKHPSAAEQQEERKRESQEGLFLCAFHDLLTLYGRKVAAVLQGDELSVAQLMPHAPDGGQGDILKRLAFDSLLKELILTKQLSEDRRNEILQEAQSVVERSTKALEARPEVETLKPRRARYNLDGAIIRYLLKPSQAALEAVIGEGLAEYGDRNELRSGFLAASLAAERPEAFEIISHLLRVNDPRKRDLHSENAQYNYEANALLRASYALHDALDLATARNMLHPHHPLLSAEMLEKMRELPDKLSEQRHGESYHLWPRDIVIEYHQAAKKTSFAAAAAGSDGAKPFVEKLLNGGVEPDYPFSLAGFPCIDLLTEDHALGQPNAHAGLMLYVASLEQGAMEGVACSFALPGQVDRLKHSEDADVRSLAAYAETLEACLKLPDEAGVSRLAEYVGHQLAGRSARNVMSSLLAKGNVHAVNAVGAMLDKGIEADLCRQALRMVSKAGDYVLEHGGLAEADSFFSEAVHQKIAKLENILRPLKSAAGSMPSTPEELLCEMVERAEGVFSVLRLGRSLAAEIAKGSSKGVRYLLRKALQDFDQPEWLRDRRTRSLWITNLEAVVFDARSDQGRQMLADMRPEIWGILTPLAESDKMPPLMRSRIADILSKLHDMRL